MGTEAVNVKVVFSPPDTRIGIPIRYRKIRGRVMHLVEPFEGGLRSLCVDPKRGYRPVVGRVTEWSDSTWGEYPNCERCG